MKILYIFTSPNSNGSSVQTKVLNQIKYLNKAGATCHGAFFSTQHTQNIFYTNSVELVPVSKTSIKYFANHFQRSLLDTAVHNYLLQNASKYDCIYYRYPGATFRLFKSVRHFKNITFEINGNLPFTIRKQKKKIAGKFSNILHNLNNYFIPISNEIIFGQRIFNTTKCIVSVSYELFSIYKKSYKLKKNNAIVSGNGISVSDYKLRNVTEKKEIDHFTFLMLKGSAVEADYLGFDRIIVGLKQYQGPDKIQVIVAGNKFENEKKLIEANQLAKYFKFIGFISKEEIDIIIDNADLAIGTLASFRSNVSELSSLKTREYFTRGLPFVISYNDTDLNENELAKPFFLKVPNDNTPINIDKLIEFCRSLTHRPEHPNQMRQIALHSLDFEPKMVNLLNELKKHYA